MTVNLLAPGQLEAIAAAIGLSLSGKTLEETGRTAVLQAQLEGVRADIKSFLGLLKPLIDSYQVVDRLPDELPAVSYPRAPGYRPSGAENPYNA
jgi:hypothetical protein